MEHVLTLGSFVFFTGLVGVLTWWLTRGEDVDSSGGYFLAGRSLTGGYIAGSLLLTNLSTEQLVGLNGAAYSDGLSVMAWEVIAACSLVAFGLIFLPRYLKSGIATIPQFLQERFDPATRTITTVIFLIAYVVILLPMILYTGAVGMTDILDMHDLTGIQSDTTLLWVMVWLIGILGSIYAIFGGLRTVAVSDTLNGFGLLAGGLLITWLGLASLGDQGPLANLQLLAQQHPEKFNSLGGSNQSVPFSTLFTGVLLLNLFYWTTNQQIIQRAFAAKNLAEGQKGVMIAGLFKILAPLILVIPGIIAFHHYGQIQLDGKRVTIVDLVTESNAFVYTVDGKSHLVQGEAADTLLSQAGVEASALTSGQTVQIDPKTQGVIERTLPTGTVITAPAGNWEYQPVQNAAAYLPPRNADKAYGKLVQSILPWYLRGFFAAVVMGAILSSYNSVLNSAATMYSLGVYRDMWHPQATDKQVIDSGKWFGVIVAVASMSLAPLLAGQKSIFGYLQDMNAIYFIPLLAVMVVGLATRTVSGWGARVGLLFSLATILAIYFIPLVKEFCAPIPKFHMLGIIFAGSVLLMLALGAWKPRNPPYEQPDSGAVDMTPWRYAWPMGIGMLLIVLGLYAAFADVNTLAN